MPLGSRPSTVHDRPPSLGDGRLGETEPLPTAGPRLCFPPCRGPRGKFPQPKAPLEMWVSSPLVCGRPWRLGLLPGSRGAMVAVGPPTACPHLSPGEKEVVSWLEKAPAWKPSVLKQPFPLQQRGKGPGQIPNQGRGHGGPGEGGSRIWLPNSPCCWPAVWPRAGQSPSLSLFLCP